MKIITKLNVTCKHSCNCRLIIAVALGSQNKLTLIKQRECVLMLMACQVFKNLSSIHSKHYEGLNSQLKREKRNVAYITTPEELKKHV